LCILIEQLNTLVDLLYEEKKINHKQEKEAKREVLPSRNGVTVSVAFINSTRESALQSAIVLFQFSVIEALVNFLTELTIQLSEENLLPKTTSLSHAEIDFLKEQSTLYDSKNGKITSRQSFKKLEEKIIGTPRLFKRTQGDEFELKKQNPYWEGFKSLKEKRDALTHQKKDFTVIHDKDIYNGSSFIYWLSHEYFNLIKDALYPSESEPYKTVEGCTYKLVNLTHFATNEKFPFEPFPKLRNEAFKTG